MTWIFKGNPFDLLYFIKERLNHEVLRDIFTTVGDECGDANEVQTIDNCPILQNARKSGKCINMESSWTLQLNLRSRSNSRISPWAKHLIQGIPIFCWNRTNSTPMNWMEFLQGIEELLRFLHSTHQALFYIVWESLHELPIRLIPKTRGCKWASNDQMLQSRRLPANFEFGGKYSTGTPRVTGEVKPILDVEVIEKIDEFVDESVDCPEGLEAFP